MNSIPTKRFGLRKFVGAMRAVLVLGTAVVATAGLSGLSARGETRLNDFLHRVFTGNEFAPKSFGPARWLEGGEAYTTLEPSKETPAGKDIVRYETATGKRDILISAAELTPPGAKQPLKIENYEWSKDLNELLIFTNSQQVWREKTRGDYWIFDKRSKKLHKVGNNPAPSSLLFATFSPDGKMLAYVRGNDIYAEDVESGKITALTSDGSPSIINGAMDWVYEEELKLFSGLRWSPDSKQVAFWHFNTNGVRKFPLVYDAGAPYDVMTNLPYPQFGLYPNIVEVPYPEAGTTNSEARVGVVAATGGETKWMDVPGDPRNNYIVKMDWAGDSTAVFIQHLNRLQNTDDILLADANTGKVSIASTDHEDAWIRVTNELRWIRGGKEFLLDSERDGWRHEYAISRDGKQVRLITPGKFDVIDVIGADPKAEWFYFTASPQNATQKYLYRSRIDGTGTPERLTQGQPGWNKDDISPDFHWAFHTYSNIDTPPVTSLVRMPEQTTVRVLEDNAELRAKVKNALHVTSELFKVDIGGGVTLDGWMLKPPNFDASKKYPLLIYVYGDVASQTVLDEWQDARGLFHRALAEEGYLVASVDNRGTPAPKGRDWRDVVYKAVGVLSSAEQAAALRVMENTRPYIDANQVAVWGWSSGGSNTLNLMFRSPELYKVGMSVAPLVEQRLYDTIYMERYMRTPAENVEGYKAGSPINFAQNLRGSLLIVHGSDDDNVHFQGTELLINRLVELGKPFDFMDYPGRTHAIAEGPGTRYHMHALLARYLESHIKAGPE